MTLELLTLTLFLINNFKSYFIKSLIINSRVIIYYFFYSLLFLNCLCLLGSNAVEVINF